jgi:hypothetical protein
MPRQSGRVLAAGLVLVAIGLLLTAYGLVFSNVCYCPTVEGRCGCYGGPLDYVVFYLWVYWGVQLWSIGVATTLVGLSLWAVGQIQGVGFDHASGSLSILAALFLIPVTLYGREGLLGYLMNATICGIQIEPCNPWISILLTVLGTAGVCMGFAGGLALMERRISRFAILGLVFAILAGAAAFFIGAFFRDVVGVIFLGAPILELSLIGLLLLKLNGTPHSLK